MMILQSISTQTRSSAAIRALALLAGLLPGRNHAAADCCSGRASAAYSAEPLSRMMGPLNEPLKVGIVNPSALTKSGTLGGIGFKLGPGKHDLEFGGTSAAHAPQPGVKLDFAGNGTGVQREACPPGTLYSSPYPLESASPNEEQYVGQARVTDNLDNVGTNREPRVHGAGGISPGQMGRMAGLPGIVPPCVHYSANIGALGSAGTLIRGSSGILRTIHGNSDGPHRITSYEINGLSVVEEGLQTFVASGGEVTELNEPNTESLEIRFRESSAHDPHKTVLITKLGVPPLGFDQAWNFTVSYPDGESANTLCAIDIPSSPSGEYRTTVRRGGAIASGHR